MYSWADQKRLVYFTCIFPALMMLLLPLPAVAFDFLLLFALFSTIIFAFTTLITQSANAHSKFIMIGFGTISLRMMLAGAAARRIGLGGPNFDGQIIRRVGEIFYSHSVEANLTIVALVYLSVRFLVMSTISQIVSDIHVQIQVRNELNFTEVSTLTESPSVSIPKKDVNKKFLIPLFFLQAARIELHLLPLFMGLGLFLGVWNRDIFTPDSVHKSIQTSALLVLSTVLCLLPAILINLVSLREWLSQIASKRVASFSFKEIFFEYRRRAMLFGISLILLSFVPNFPRIFLVIYGGVLFAVGFLSDVLTPRQGGLLEVEIGQTIRQEKAFQREERVHLQLGRTVWNNYFVDNEDAFFAAINLARMQVIERTGMIIEEIPIEFNRRLHPESVCVTIQRKRVSVTTFEIDEIHPQTGVQAPISHDRMLKMLCSDFVESLCKNSVHLSHDPALDYLTQEFEFKS